MKRREWLKGLAGIPLITLLPNENVRVLYPEAFGALSDEDIAAGKCRITKVGTVNGDRVIGWAFDGSATPNSIAYEMDSNANVRKVGGWTLAELTRFSRCMHG